jgi:hypothetical protein
MRSVAIGLAVVPLLGLAACDTDGDGWDPDAQFAPSLRPAIGVRVTDGDLRLWTGTPCRRVTRVTLTFDAGTGESGRWELASRKGRGVLLEKLSLDGPNRGFRVVEPLPDGYDWGDAAEVSFVADAADQPWGTDTDLDVVRDESAEHAEDVYYFDHVGWLDEAAVTERNGTDFLTPCTPDPAD